MIVNMSNSATPEQINHVIERIKECGYQAHVIQGAERTIIGAVGNGERRSELEALRAAPGASGGCSSASSKQIPSRSWWTMVAVFEADKKRRVSLSENGVGRPTPAERKSPAIPGARRTLAYLGGGSPADSASIRIRIRRPFLGLP